jgi:hypothetical protein
VGNGMTIRRVDRGRYHWYEDENGVRVPGVTGIQSRAIPKQDILIPWATGLSGDCVIDHWDEIVAMPPSERRKFVAGASRRSNDAAKVKGTKVHTLGAAVSAGEEVVVPAELVGYVEAYTQFLFDYDAQIFLSEAVVWSKTHGYCGTLDMGVRLVVGRNEDGTIVVETWLIDVKTGSGVYDDVAFQLAPYRNADVWVDYSGLEPVEHEMPTFDRCGVLHVREDGYSLHEVEVTEETYRGFLYLQASAAAIKANEGAVGEPLDPPIRLEF